MHHAWIERPQTILFHHGIGADPDIWNGWFARLIDRYRIVRFDMRGYGRSVIPPEDFAWSVEVMTGDVLAVADAAGIGRANLVGESIGGTMMLNFALAHPERTASLTVSNGAHLGASIEGVNAWLKQLDVGGVKGWSDQFMRDRFFPGAISAEQWAWYAKRQETWPRHTILNAIRVLVGADLRPKLGALRCPTLLLHPDSSPFIPVEVTLDLHRRLPGSWLQVFAQTKHGLPFSHADQCAAVLRKFLDEVGGATSGA